MENVIVVLIFLTLNGITEGAFVWRATQCTLEIAYQILLEMMTLLHVVLELSLTISKENVLLVLMGV